MIYDDPCTPKESAMNSSIAQYGLSCISAFVFAELQYVQCLLIECYDSVSNKYPSHKLMSSGSRKSVLTKQVGRLLHF
jgi:hypothetical protein